MFCFVFFSGFGVSSELPPVIASKLQKNPIAGNDNNNNLNINLPEHNAVLRLEVELRDKNARRRPNYRQKGFATDRNRNIDPVKAASKQVLPTTSNFDNYFVPMEKVSFILFPLFFVLSARYFFSLVHFYSFLLCGIRHLHFISNAIDKVFLCLRFGFLGSTNIRYVLVVSSQPDTCKHSFVHHGNRIGMKWNFVVSNWETKQHNFISLNQIKTNYTVAKNLFYSLFKWSERKIRQQICRQKTEWTLQIFCVLFLLV